jgi:hypothetical protein
MPLNEDLMIKRNHRLLLIFLGIAAVVVASIFLIETVGERISVAEGKKANSPVQSTGSPTASASVALVHPNSSPKQKSAMREPLPAPMTPLKQSFEKLKELADSGDSEAATRLFDDTRRCARASLFSSIAKRYSRALLNQDISQASFDQLQQVNTQLGMLQEQQKFQSDSNALCADLSDSELSAALPTALEAAKLGDSNAADCYVGANFSMIPGGILNHPEWLQEFKDNAAGIANQAVAQGDWTMVGLLQNAYSPNSNSLLSQVVGRDPVQYYQYLKLWSMGMSSQDDSAFVNGKLAAAAAALNVNQLATADAWAQQTYGQYFNSNPNGAQGSINACPAD